MDAVLKCKLKSGEVVEVCKYSFAKHDFVGAAVISGDKYYVKKAVSLGAKDIPKKAKTKE